VEEQGEPDAAVRAGQRAPASLESAALDRRAEHLKRAAIAAEALTGPVVSPGRSALISRMRTGRAEFAGNPVHVDSAGQLRLRRAKSRNAPLAACWSSPPGRGCERGRIVRAARVNQPARQHDGTEVAYAPPSKQASMSMAVSRPSPRPAPPAVIVSHRR